MKKLLMLVILFMATICNAQVGLETNKAGAVRVRAINVPSVNNPQEWVPSEITASREAIRCRSKFSQAIANPGEKILGEKTEKTLRLKPIFKKVVEIKEYFIVYDGSKKTIDLIESSEKKECHSYLILFNIVSLLLMIISNISYKKIKNVNYYIAAVIISLPVISTIFAGVVINSFFKTLPNTVAVPIIGCAAFLALFTLVFSIFNDDRCYKVTSVIYYILMAACSVLLFV